MHYRYKIKNSQALKGLISHLKLQKADGIYTVEEQNATLVGCFSNHPLTPYQGAKLMSCDDNFIDWQDQWNHQEISVRLHNTHFLLKPGAGFGDASHPTTQLCLKALELTTAPAVIDIGSGSGILSIAAHFLGVPAIFSIEIDEAACSHHRENCKLNQLTEPVIFHDLAMIPLISCKPLILINMILSEQKEALKNCPPELLNKGIWYCSGILKSDIDQAVKFYENLGLHVQRIDTNGIWVGLALIGS
jgi:ribosomal protein L11 methylase PrmA